MRGLFIRQLFDLRLHGGDLGFQVVDLRSVFSLELVNRLLLIVAQRINDPGHNLRGHLKIFERFTQAIGST